MVIAMTAFPSIDMVRTGKRIETVRKSRGFSVKDIQEYFGFEYPQAVYKWQHGECLPSVDNLFALARLLRVGMEDLLVACGSEDREVPLFAAKKQAEHHSQPGRCSACFCFFRSYFILSGTVRETGLIPFQLLRCAAQHSFCARLLRFAKGISHFISIP